MEKQLTPGEVRDRRKICVIHGLGGIGKTQLAIEYARLHKDLYTSFFWIDGKTEESLIQSLLRIASRLPESQILDMDTQKIRGLEESRKAAQEILKWFALKGNTQWLLVFDNIDKTSYEESDQHTEISSYDITQYFPGNDTGSIIVTTRLQRLVSLGSPIPLRKLSILDGLLILENHTRRSLRRSGRQATSEDMSEIEDWDPG
jgi:NB-ARC domain